MSKKKILRISLNLGLVAAVALLAWIFGPSLFIEAQYRVQVKQQKSGEPTIGFAALMYSLPEVSGTAKSGFAEMLYETQAMMVPISTEFGIVIPKIFANVAITENVNPEDNKVYQQVLKQAGGVAHAAGSAVPGEPGTIYIFGHSTDATINVERYNAVFYLLRKLEAGDEIIVYYQNKPYRYIVSEKKIVNPTDISDIVNIENEERLVLQTCWPPGTTWKRLLIVARLWKD